MIADAIESVRANEGVTVEHIVVDGGSTDGTIEAVRRYPHVRLIVAAGSGIYEALNIGIKAAQGGIIGHLNSDDLLPRGALAAVAAAFDRNPDAESVRGMARYVRLDENGKGPASACVLRDYPQQLDLPTVVDGELAINTIFTRAEAYRRIGPYDETLPLAADREWLLRAHIRGLRIVQIEADTYVYRIHAKSLTLDPAIANSRKLRAEAVEIARRYLRDPATPREVQRLCLRWHAKNAALMAASHLRLHYSVSTFREFFATDPFWPVRFLSQIPALVTRRIRRRLQAI